MRTLFFAFYAEKHVSVLLEGGFMSPVQARMLRKTLRSLLTSVRSDAVPLVDAFGFPDYLLNSMIGKYDGNVYEALYELTKSDPMNKTRVPPTFDRVLKPLLRGEANIQSHL